MTSKKSDGQRLGYVVAGTIAVAALSCISAEAAKAETI
jgi:hypothetical protein